jgi:dethiobiotin synthase
LISGIFITGTDTGVGKTVVTAGILRWLRQCGVDAIPMKPVQTGSIRQGNRLTAPDLKFCFAAAGMKPPKAELKLLQPYLYHPACSPHLAGRMVRAFPEIEHIRECASLLTQKHQIVIVEGAGGIMVPLNESETMLDLMVALGYPVLLVARTGLGTINHSLLSLKALRDAGLDLPGVIFNQTEPLIPSERFIAEDNPQAVAKFSRVNVLGVLRYGDYSRPREAATWQHFTEDVPGLAIIARLFFGKPDGEIETISYRGGLYTGTPT